MAVVVMIVGEHRKDLLVYEECWFAVRKLLGGAGHSQADSPHSAQMLFTGGGEIVIERCLLNAAGRGHGSVIPICAVLCHIIPHSPHAEDSHSHHCRASALPRGYGWRNNRSMAVVSVSSGRAYAEFCG